MKIKWKINKNKKLWSIINEINKWNKQRKPERRNDNYENKQKNKITLLRKNYKETYIYNNMKMKKKIRQTWKEIKANKMNLWRIK